MEKALLAENLTQLEKVIPGKFQRIYFGSETCEAKIPSVLEVRKAKHFCKKHGFSFSLLSPFCTDSGLKRLQQLFSLLSKEDEIIVNDFGVLYEAKKFKPELVAGRLLNKQFRDPRIASFRGSFPEEMIEHLSLSQASTTGFAKILNRFAVRRVELDNLLQGIATSLGSTGIKVSLYYPIVFVAATRMCLLANSGKISESKRVGIFPCMRDCSKFRFRLSNDAMPSKLLLVGNCLFFENNKLPSEKELAAKGVDRLVINRALWPEKD